MFSTTSRVLHPPASQNTCSVPRHVYCYDTSLDETHPIDPWNTCCHAHHVTWERTAREYGTWYRIGNFRSLFALASCWRYSENCYICCWWVLMTMKYLPTPGCNLNFLSCWLLAKSTFTRSTDFNLAVYVYVN